MIETRSPAECRQVAAAQRGSFVAVELEPSRLDSALDLLFDLGTGFADAACAVVAARTMRTYEPLALELGAVAFVVSPLELDRMCDLAERHIARTVVEPIDIRQRIWENLPWK